MGRVTAETEDEIAHAAALAGLPKLDDGRLRWLMGLDPLPSKVWKRISDGRLPPTRELPRGTVGAWRRHVASTSPEQVMERCLRADVRVLTPACGDYPARLADDPQAPAVLFAHGDLGILDAPTATLVGTRRATGYGRDAARLLGRRLASEGVVVVSGMASGIDVASQRGALSACRAAVAGVAGSGLDVVYPPESRDVWRALGEHGLLLSEAPPGSPASWFRFPERNRIMAALADVLVVVETPARGGSLNTVDHAIRRNVPVMAVPGPITSNASLGTNRLLADGCGVAYDADEVLIQLGVTPRASGRGKEEGRARRPEPAPEDRAVLEALDLTPTLFDTVMARTGIPPLELASALYRLEAAGWARSGPGWWERRVR